MGRMVCEIMAIVIVVLLSTFLYRIHVRKTRLQKASAYGEGTEDTYQCSPGDLQQMIDVLPLPICIIDSRNGSILYGNNAFRNCILSVGKPAEECGIWEMMPAYQCDGKSSRDHILLFMQQVLQAGMPVISEQEYQRGEEGRILMRVTGTKVNYQEKLSVSMVFQDISAQKREEEMLQSLAAKEREASKLQSKFIISMSHEIRTPMNGIIGLADVQLRKNHDGEIRNVFDKISLSAKHLLSIVNDILDYSKIEANKLILTQEEFVLENIIYESMLTAHEKIGEKQVKMILRLERNVPRKVMGDAVRFWQIMQNILDNSAKYTEYGSIVLDIALDGEEEEGQRLFFRIADTGKGMNPAQLEKIYIPFEQFHAGNWKNSGTGLGLPITKQLVERMGGTIAIESSEGEGTVTEIRIPFGISEGRELFLEEEDYGILKGKRILLVEELPVCAQVSCELLNRVGALASACSSLEEARDRIFSDSQQEEAYDVIVLHQGIEEEQLKELKEYPFKKTRFLTMRQPYKPTQFLERLCALLGGVSPSYKLRNKKYYFPRARILVCEDNEINQDVIMGALELYDIQVVIAGNGADGIAWLEKEEFHLVIMDIQMPVMDGQEATRWIRNSDKEYREIPIIAMTANAMNEEMAFCQQDGINGYVAKPIELERLYTELLKWLPMWVREEKEMADDPAAFWEELEESKNSRKTELEKLGIDVKEATARFAGKYDMFCKSLRKFALDIDQNGMMDVGEAAEAEPEELRKYIHGMKGVTANLSMKEDNRMICEMEQTIRDGIPNMDLYRQLYKHLSQVAKDILQILGQEKAKPLETGSWEECVPILMQLKEFLVKGKARECDQTVSQIRARAWENVDSGLLDQICASVEEYNYARTSEILEQLLV